MVLFGPTQAEAERRALSIHDEGRLFRGWLGPIVERYHRQHATV